MNVYLMNMIMLYGSSRFSKIITKNDNNKMFVIISVFQFILLSGLRHITIGPDAWNYRNMLYKAVYTRSWKYVFESLLNTFQKGRNEIEGGFLLFEKVIGSITLNYSFYFIVVAAIFTIPFGMFIYKNSKNYLISFIVYQCLFFSFYGTTGLRQTIATAIIVFFGFEYIKARKIIPFLFLAFIAFLFHKSSVVFILFYFIGNKKIKWQYILSSLGLSITLFFVSKPVFIYLAGIIGYDSYAKVKDYSNPITFTIMLLLLLVLALFKFKEIENENKQYCLNALLIAVFFLPLVFVDPTTLRIVMYFCLFLVILIPDIFLSFKGKDQTLVFFIGVSLLMILYFKSHPQYLFFWEDSGKNWQNLIEY